MIFRSLSAENPQKTIKFMIPGSKIGSVRYNGPSDNALADKGVYVIAANQSTGLTQVEQSRILVYALFNQDFVL